MRSGYFCLAIIFYCAHPQNCRKAQHRHRGEQQSRESQFDVRGTRNLSEKLHKIISHVYEIVNVRRGMQTEGTST